MGCCPLLEMLRPGVVNRHAVPRRRRQASWWRSRSVPRTSTTTTWTRAVRQSAARINSGRRNDTRLQPRRAVDRGRPPRVGSSPSSSRSPAWTPTAASRPSASPGWAASCTWWPAACRAKSCARRTPARPTPCCWSAAGRRRERRVQHLRRQRRAGGRKLLPHTASTSPRGGVLRPLPERAPWCGARPDGPRRCRASAPTGTVTTSTVVRRPEPALFRAADPGGVDTAFGQGGAERLAVQEFQAAMIASRPVGAPLPSWLRPRDASSAPTPRRSRRSRATPPRRSAASASSCSARQACCAGRCRPTSLCVAPCWAKRRAESGRVGLAARRYDGRRRGKFPAGPRPQR